MALVYDLSMPLSRFLRSRRLAEESFLDLLLHGGGREDDDPVPHLELRVAMGAEDLAVPDEGADVRFSGKADGLDLLVRRRRARRDLRLNDLEIRPGERHERHEAAGRELLLDDPHEHA